MNRKKGPCGAFFMSVTGCVDAGLSRFHLHCLYPRRDGGPGNCRVRALQAMSASASTQPGSAGQLSRGSRW